MKRSPDFIGIGAGRSGTRWMTTCLYEHPEVGIPMDEPSFFSREKNWARGYDWYESLFSKYSGKKVIGESSTSYFSHPETPERIFNRYPKIKLIVSLRNPVKRTFSQFINDIKSGIIPKETFFLEALKINPDYINRSSYATNLRRYLNFFPKDQILILIYEDGLTDPGSFIRRVYEFIGVPANFRPVYLNKKVNEGRIPKFIWLDRLFINVSDFLRNNGLQGLWWMIKKSGLPTIILKKVNTEKGGDREPILSEEEEKIVWEMLKGEVEELEFLLGYKIKQWPR